MVQGFGIQPFTAETDFTPKPVHVRFVVDKVHCARSSSVYCGFPFSHSTSAWYSFTALTPMLKYKCTYNLIKRQRRYKNHVTIWRLICYANSATGSWSMPYTVFVRTASDTAWPAKRIDSGTVLFAASAEGAMTSRITRPRISKGMTKSDVRER